MRPHQVRKSDQSHLNIAFIIANDFSYNLSVYSEWVLHDLQSDSQDMINLYVDPNYQQVVIDMKQKPDQLGEKYQDSDSLDQYYTEYYENKM